MLKDFDRDYELNAGKRYMWKAVSDGRIYRLSEGAYRKVGAVKPEYIEEIIAELRAFDAARFENGANRRAYSIKQGALIVAEFNERKEAETR